MTDPYQALERACRHLARRPIPERWREQPALRDQTSIVAIVDTIRDAADRQAQDRSDRTIRALATVGRRDPDAHTVLLHAIADGLRRRLGRTTTSEYRADVLADLAVVILEADDLDRVDRLATRLANRAHNRAHKRSRRVHLRGDRHPTTVEPCPPERLTRLHDRFSHTDDVAELATDRVALDRFHTAIVRAIADGELTAAVWDSYRDGRLTRAFVADLPVTTARERTETHRAGRRLRPFVNAQLLAHVD